MSWIYSNLLLLFSLVPAFAPTHVPHPLHVSTTDVNFNIKEKSLEISCRIFTDDFEKILSKQFSTKTDLSKKEMHKAMDVLVEKYLLAHLRFNVNTKNVNWTYVGFELDHEATNVYLEINNTNSLQQVSLTNSVLYDLYDDQMNIVHISNAGIRKSTRANYPSKELAVKFN